jgi:hypothetical protein
MKSQALMIAVALAAGTALAQAPYGGAAKAPAESSTMSAGETMEKAPAKVQKKKVAKKKVQKHEAAKHASTKHRREHAKAGMHSSMRAMGAGVASPATDLEAKSRQDRIDQAYANWRAKQ